MTKRIRFKPMDIRKLSEFMQKEMDNRHISGREFAKLVGVSHGTVNRLLSFDDAKTKNTYPSLDFLLKLAKATGMDVCYLMALIAPDSTKIITDPDGMKITQEIESLDETAREAVKNLISGYAQNANKGSKRQASLNGKRLD